MPPLDENLRSNLAKYFEGRDDVRFVTLFGSVAMGTDKVGSDVDIAILGRQPFSSDDLVQMTTDLSLLLGREIDLIDLASSYGAILEEAITKGQKILQKSPEDFAMLLKKMWYDKEDDGRFRQKTQKTRLSLWKK